MLQRGGILSVRRDDDRDGMNRKRDRKKRDDYERRCFQSTAQKESGEERASFGGTGRDEGTNSDIESVFDGSSNVQNAGGPTLPGSHIRSTVGLCRGPTAPLSHTSVPLSHPTSLATA